MTRKLDCLLWKDRLSWLWLVGGFLVAAVGLLAWYAYKIEPSTVEGHVVAEVLFTTSHIDEDTGFRLRVDARLEYGSEIVVRTRSMGLSGGVTDTVCLEQRLGESGRRYYRIVARELCKND